MSLSLEQFEQCCLSGLSKELLLFRDSPHGIHTMEYFLQTKHESVQFMALSILQHVLMSQVHMIPSAINQLYHIITHPEILGRLPSNVVASKLYQVLASLIKRCYNDMNKDDILALIRGLNTLNSLRFIAALLVEFNCRGWLGIYGVQLQFHRQTHVAFQTHTLQPCFAISMELLKVASLALEKYEVDAHQLIHYSFLLLGELFEWEFGVIDLRTAEGKSTDILSLPSEWASQLLDPTFVGYVFWVHTTCKCNLYAGGDNYEVWLAPHKSTRDIILAICSFSGKIFANSEVRKNFAELLLANLNPLFSSSFEGITQNEAKREDLQALCAAAYKLLVNFKIINLTGSSHFSPFLHTLHLITESVAKEIKNIASLALQKILAGTGQSLDDVDDALFDDWKWNLLEQLLDFWIIILTDPSSASVRSESQEAREGPIILSRDNVLVQQAFSLFNDVMSSLLLSILVDSLATADEEEVDEIEAVSSRKIEGLITSVCVLGRANILGSLQITIPVIESSIKYLVGATTNGNIAQVSSLESQRILETLRICLIILSKLLSDAGEADGDMADAAVIPSAMLDASLENPSTFPPLVKSAYFVVVKVLEIQLHLRMSSASNPFYSQVIVTSCLTFMKLYVLAYVEPDTSLYSSDTAGALPGIFFTIDNDVLNSSHFITETTNILLRSEGLNAEIIASICGVVATASMKYNMRESMVHSGGFQILWNSVTQGTFSSTLSAESFLSLFNALGLVALRIENNEKDTFGELCGVVAKEMSSIESSELSAQLWIGKMSGLAKCAADRQGIFAQLLLYSLPLFSQLLPKYIHSDPTVRVVINLLNIIAERHLFALRPAICICFYNCAQVIIECITARLNKGVPNRSVFQNEEQIFRCEVICDILQLLCQLGTKEFMLDDQDESVDVATIAAFETQIISTLFDGFVRIMPLMTFESLTLFPVAIERYVSYIAFLINSHEKQVLQFLTSGRKPLFFLMLEHILHCAIHATPSVGQLSLRCLESLAESLWRSKGQYEQDVIQRLYACETALLDWMLSSFLAGGGSGQSSFLDRFDAFSASLLALIRIGPEVFRVHLLEKAAAQYPAVAQLFHSFLAGFTFDLSSLDRSNRRLFTQKLREFTDDLKSHSAFANSQLA